MEEAEGSFKFTFNDMKTLTRVEMPCFTDDLQKCYDMMGGEDMVSDILKDNAVPLQFRFPTDNMNKSNLSASTINKNGFLLRIRRPKSGQQPSTIEVVGAVPKSHVFDNIADYQVYNKLFCSIVSLCISV